MEEPPVGLCTWVARFRHPHSGSIILIFNQLANTSNRSFPLLKRIENIVTSLDENTKGFWWQAENGVENVAIQFDLEAEFHFTHLVIVFQTFRPAAMLIERSSDGGKTWKEYQFYAHNCTESFPHVKRGQRQRIDDVTCETQYSGVEPTKMGESKAFEGISIEFQNHLKF